MTNYIGRKLNICPLMRIYMYMRYVKLRCKRVSYMVT